MIPFSIKTVDVGPFCESIYDSITTPSPVSISDFNSSISATNKIISNNSVIPFPVKADISTDGIVPPYDSTIIFSLNNCCFTISGSAPGLSILLRATIVEMFAFLICSIASLVCFFTPSTASITKTAISAKFDPLALIAENDSCPGVSIKVILRPS